MDAMPTSYYSYARRRQSSGPGACAVGLFFAAVVAYLFFVASSMAAGPLSATLPEKDSYEVRDYATRATYSARDGSVFYGDARERRAPAAPLPGDAYEQVARGMPVARVDVALARGDGRLLLVQRARGLWRWPGGRLRFGETFFEAAERKIRDEVGVEAEARAVLLTTNAFFPESAGGGAAQTVNVLVLAAVADDAPADSLEICGDRPGPCRARGVRSVFCARRRAPRAGHDGAFGRYRWAEVDAERGGDPYVAAGLAAVGRFRADARTTGALDPPLEPGAATAVI